MRDVSGPYDVPLQLVAMPLPNLEKTIGFVGDTLCERHHKSHLAESSATCRHFRADRNENSESLAKCSEQKGRTLTAEICNHAPLVLSRQFVACGHMTDLSTSAKRPGKMRVLG